MRRDKKKYQEELLKKLSKSPGLKKEKELITQLFKKPLFWIAAGPGADVMSLAGANSICRGRKGPKKEKCLECFNRVLKKAKKSRKLERFLCPARCGEGFCLPLVQGDALYGFLLVCHLQSRPSREFLRLFEALNSTLLEKAQKELELSKLYQSIRPRAIALSTVHTIYRLISSSLNLDELLPRIARLTLQILRARRCVISLVDKKTKRLVLKTVIDLSKKKIKLQISPILKRVESRVMHSGNILLKKSYLSVPLIDEEPIGIITVSEKTNRKPFDNFDREILTALSEQAVGAIKNAQLYKEQEDMLLGTVKSLSTLLKVKSGYPYAHSKIFMDIVMGIAKELHCSEEELRNLRFAAMLHDAGKIGIPEEILKKPAQLSGREYEIVKRHPKKGAKILSPLERLKPAVEVILHHHEKFDGTGYPDKLKGEKIPLGARIMAVADSFEAMISRRPYRKSTSILEAIEEIKRQSGRQFDPRVIKAFLKFARTKPFEKLIFKRVHLPAEQWPVLMRIIKKEGAHV